MSSIEEAVRAVFLTALQPGPSNLAAAAQSALADCARLSEKEFPAQLGALGEHLVCEFNVTFNLPTGLPHEACLADIDGGKWAESIRGALAVLEDWNHSPARSLHTLRVILTVLHILAMNVDGLRCVASDLRHLLPDEALGTVIRTADPKIWTTDSRTERLGEALKAAATAQDLESVAHLRYGITPHFELDVTAAIALLFAVTPKACADSISQARSIVTGLLALEVLADDGFDLALKSTSPTLKLMSLLRVQEKPEDTKTQRAAEQRVEAVLREASGSGLWESWVRALRFPTRRPLIDRAMGRIMADADATAWRVFLDSLALMHSGIYAEAMSTLFQAFVDHAEARQAMQVWKLAFKAWDQWNYGAETKSFHGWVPTTMLDFPVAKYYAALDGDALDRVEAQLIARLEGLDLEWHQSESQLITAWNALHARLRLVRHGRHLAGGGNSVLPASPQEPPDDYSAIRYRFLR